jgi:hypothetical protein
MIARSDYRTLVLVKSTSLPREAMPADYETTGMARLRREAGVTQEQGVVDGELFASRDIPHNH